MESKNLKVIDEHGIDRDANILFSIDVDGSDYVIYWIERDSDNDNVFVSKIIKNIDGTSNMLNIEDSMEKGKIVEVVKELIKYSIDNENDKLSTNSVVLPSGKKVEFASVLVNKEQNINVQKTYITTVKKSVVKVAGDYYDVKFAGTSQVPTEVFPNVVEPVVPVVENVVTSEMPIPTPVVEPVVQVTEPNEVAASTVEPSVVLPTLEDVKPAVEPVIPVPVVEPAVAAPVAPVSVEPVAPVVIPQPEVVAPKVEVPIEPLPTVISPTPQQVVQTPAVEPVVTPVESSDNRLVFDASKETNLNVALGEVSNESNITVDNVSSIREFGVEETVVPQTPVVEVKNEENQVNVPNSNAGFANSKIFMFIAIAFFLASCIFLGYEVFNYFKIGR